ncbi:hypothetical protein DYH09_22710 [bacterium CPR1]|nr:hypothetical protein [bacterium CPR1]
MMRFLAGIVLGPVTFVMLWPFVFYPMGVVMAGLARQQDPWAGGTLFLAATVTSGYFLTQWVGGRGHFGLGISWGLALGGLTLGLPLLSDLGFGLAGGGGCGNCAMSAAARSCLVPWGAGAVLGAASAQLSRLVIRGDQLTHLRDCSQQ